MGEVGKVLPQGTSVVTWRDSSVQGGKCLGPSSPFPEAFPSSSEYKRGPGTSREAAGLAQVTRVHRGLLTRACWGFPEVLTKRSKVLSFSQTSLLPAGGVR